MKLSDIKNVVGYVARKYEASNYDIEWVGGKDFFSRDAKDRTVRFDFKDGRHARIAIGKWLSVYFSNTRHGGAQVPDTLLYDELREYLDIELKSLINSEALEKGGESDAT